MIRSLLLLPTLVAAIKVSPPKGHFNVMSSTLELIDHNRIDPFAPDKEPRRLLLSVFRPLAPHEPCRRQETPYMPPETATVYDEMYAAFGVPNGTFASLRNELCQAEKHPGFPASYPLVLFSPGLGNSRLLYSVMATSLSSHGFVVVTVDHPYDAVVVEYPDGSVVRGANISTDDEIIKTLTTRKDDMSFIIDHLSSRRQPILILGHSLGGATAAAAMIHDSRICSGVNLDGDFFDPFIEPGIDCPFMLMGREYKTFTTDGSWGRMWRRLRSTKVDVEVKGFRHGSFTDLPLLVERLGLQVGEMLGGVGGRRAVEIVVGVVVGFFRGSVGGERDVLDGRLQEMFPEVEVVESVRGGRCGWRSS